VTGWAADLSAKGGAKGAGRLIADRGRTASKGGASPWSMALAKAMRHSIRYCIGGTPTTREADQRAPRGGRGSEAERLHEQNFNKTIDDKIAAWSVGERRLDDRVQRALEPSRRRIAGLDPVLTPVA
jgi:hypothetical protein